VRRAGGPVSHDPDPTDLNDETQQVETQSVRDVVDHTLYRRRHSALPSLTECFLKPRPNEPLPFPRHGDTHFRAVETWRRVSGSKGAPISCSHCCFRSCSSTTFGVFLASYGGCWFDGFPDGDTVRASRLRHQHGGS
jgi:hypothetical protein